jgi:hypothetical protein
VKKFIVILIVGVSIVTNTSVSAKPINEADTKLCDTLYLALMSSLREPVDKGIVEIYKDDENAPKGLRWDVTGAEIIKIKQVHGIGGLYEITLKTMPFHKAHITYGEDIITVNTNGELISYKHLKTYPQ